jgi:hypothetical protein
MPPLQILRSIEGRRQKEYCPLPSAATKGSKGLSPTPKSLIWCPAISVGLFAERLPLGEAYTVLQPSAFCLLPPAFFTITSLSPIGKSLTKWL